MLVILPNYSLKIPDHILTLQCLISRFFSIIFLSTSVALNILSFHQLFHDFENFMSLFGHFQFWAHTYFLEVICPRYAPSCLCCCHNRNHFFLHKQNKSSESKGKFRQASNCCRRVLKAAKHAYTNKTRVNFFPETWLSGFLMNCQCFQQR